MTLHDQIIDEAEELARLRVLPTYPSREQITDAISEIVGIQLAYNSVGAYLAEAAHNRIYFAVMALETA